MKTQFADTPPYVGGYRLVLIPFQDVGENFGPDKSARQIADRQLIFGEDGRTRRGGIMLHGWAPFRETCIELLIKHLQALFWTGAIRIARVSLRSIELAGSAPTSRRSENRHTRSAYRRNASASVIPLPSTGA